MVGIWVGLWLVVAPQTVLSSPSPLAQPQVDVSPLPLPTIPGLLSPSPTPSSSTSGGGANPKSGGSSGSQSSSGGFGPSGIVAAFPGGTTAAASTSDPGAASPAPYVPAPAPQPFLSNPGYLFPDRNAAQSAALPLLLGLLLLSLGLWLMAMRHRREALASATLERTKTDFLNLASHELRGPLTVLKGYVANAREGHFGSLPGPLADRLPQVQVQLARMEMLVEQMLETARLEVGGTDLHAESTDLRRIVQNAIPTERLEAGDHRVDLQVPDLPVTVDVDERRIEQVIHNLVDNAIKYSEPPARVRVDLSVEGDRARLTVADRGFGISPEDMSRLFTRFGRIVTDANSHVPGVGLGLYLGREVARRHGGDLVAESGPESGSTFTLTLPLHDPDAEPAAPRTVGAPPGQRALRWFARLLPNRARGSVS